MTDKEKLRNYIKGQKFMRKTLGKLDKVIMLEIYRLFKNRNTQ